MEINKSLISKLERLSRLELSDQERTQLTGDLSAILQMVDKLNEVDTNNVEPLVYISDAVFMGREDQVKNQVDRQKALANAPDQDGIYFKLPKVIDL